MKHSRYIAALALAAVLAAPAYAATLDVEGVASPAWVERAGGSREPLAVGAVLRDRDRVVTGPGARALLRLADGSAVKLGENAQLGVDDLARRQQNAATPVVTASLDVARGAFRFTTGIFSRRKSGRDVTIRIATVTAGIRGTDVWGKSADERDIVCLIEGRISVNHAGKDFTMSEPLSFFIAPRKGAPQPVAPVDPKQLAEWAAETEIARDSGASRRGGRHAVIVSSAADQGAALADYDRLRLAGYPARILPVKGGEGHAFEVRIAGLPGHGDAKALAERLNALGYADARAAM